MSTKYKTINIVPVTFQFAVLTMDVLEAAPNHQTGGPQQILNHKWLFVISQTESYTEIKGILSQCFIANQYYSLFS